MGAVALVPAVVAGAAPAEGAAGSFFATGRAPVGAAGFAGPDPFGVGAGCSLRGESDRPLDGFDRWKTVRIPPPADPVRAPAGWSTAPAAARVLSVEIGRPHFGQFGNEPMQCWQSGAPHECKADAIPPHPTHRGGSPEG